MQISIGSLITYTKSNVGAENPNAVKQLTDELYTSIVVSIESTRYAVRADGFQGTNPLYYVDLEDVIEDKGNT